MQRNNFERLRVKRIDRIRNEGIRNLCCVKKERKMMLLARIFCDDMNMLEEWTQTGW